MSVSALLPLRQTTGGWPPGILLGCGGPCPSPENTTATKMWPLSTLLWEEHHTGGSTQEGRRPPPISEKLWLLRPLLDFA